MTPEDLSHALLVAVLMNNGGSLDLPGAALEADALGGADGSWHAIEMTPDPINGTIRLSVRPRPDMPGGGVVITE
ncbi:pRL2-19 [Streptomyces parvus]|uniref:pRL2-19 n=1 Tax=Streptomyces parvus TaxID=66428 RepID=UPI0033335FA8